MSNERGYFSQVDAGRSVLAGHRPTKRKIASPLSNLPSARHVNTTADIFPELLWIALLFEHHGYHRAIRVAAPFRKALAQLDDKRPWYRTSEIAKLKINEWNALSEDEGTFKHDVATALSSLLVYPQLPLEFVRDQQMDREKAIRELEQCVGHHSNRFETPGAATIGTFVFLEAYAGRICVPPNVLEGISSIVDKPGSDEAELAASGARALTLAFWGADCEDNSWPADFWRTNRELSPCRAGKKDG